jgi:serine/threonine protein kinase
MHRDLKCANILVMGDGTLKITDFGTAKLLGSPRTSRDSTKNRSKSMENISANPSLKGTPYYMAPEVLRRTGHGLSADIWSLGCLVIEMLTAKAPWTSLTSDFEEIIGYILSGIHPPHPKGLTDDCEHFLTSCLQHVPSQRPTCLSLLNHKWITRPHEDLMPLYKNSLSKTNDDYY